MLIGYHRGQGSIVLRVKILNSSVSTGAGLTGLLFSSAGLIISTIVDNEATATAYTAAGSTTETITTLGTYVAPTATKCRFKEVDATNHKGIYEVQIADARFAVASGKSVLVSISGATNAAETDIVIPLTDIDPYDSVRAGLTALPNAAAGANSGLLTCTTGNVLPTNAIVAASFAADAITDAKVAADVTIASVTGAVGSVTGAVGSVAAGGISAASFAAGAIDATAIAANAIGASELASDVITDIWQGTAITEAYAADGAAATPAQLLYMIWAFLAEKNVASTTLTAKKLDGSTSAMTFTLDSATAPTTITRAT